MGPHASLKFPIFVTGVGGAIKIVFNKVGQWLIFQEDKFRDMNENMLSGLLEQFQI